MGLLGTLLGKTNEAAQELIKNGAVIIDVRTPAEYRGGNVAGSKNIPLNEIQSKEKEIMKNKNGVVFCCVRFFFLCLVLSLSVVSVSVAVLLW